MSSGTCSIATCSRARCRRRAGASRIAIGERLEAAWGDRSAEIAPELAVHFAAADTARAIRYHLAAANAARSRFAEREAVLHLRAAVEHLRETADTTERARTELACLIDLGGALFATRGAASNEGLDVHRRVLEAERLDVPEARFRAQTGLYTGAAVRAELHRARAIADDLLVTAAQVGKPFFTFIGHVSAGYALIHQGEFARAHRHLADAHAMWRPHFPTLTVDSSMVARAMLGFIALIRAEPETGHAWIENSLGARRGHPEPLQPGLWEPRWRRSTAPPRVSETWRFGTPRRRRRSPPSTAS